jgi:hypothetical protein
MYQRHGPEHHGVARTLIPISRIRRCDVAKALGFPHALAEWRNLLAGTMIVRGRGTAIVVAIGQGQHELEHIASMTAKWNRQNLSRKR